MVAASFSLSRNGTLEWRAGHAALSRLTWFDRGGRVLGVAGPPCNPEWVRLSPDESHIICETPIDNAAFSIAETGHSGFFPLRGADGPVWMPGTSDIVYGKQDGEVTRILERAPAGGPEKELVRVPGPIVGINDISPDGKILLYEALDGGARATIYTVRLGDGPGSAKPEAFATAFASRFSPDGRWIVYAAPNPGGRPNLHTYVQSFPLHGPPSQLDEGGAASPAWRGDGKEILYYYLDTIYAVQVEIQGGTFRPSPPQPLFKVRRPGGLHGPASPLAVTRDGQRILFAEGVEQPDPQLNYAMTSWDSKLK